MGLRVQCSGFWCMSVRMWCSSLGFGGLGFRVRRGVDSLAQQPAREHAAPVSLQLHHALGAPTAAFLESGC